MSTRQPLKDIEFIASFAAFCRTKGDEKYDYGRPDACALARFLRDTGRVGNDAQPCGLYRYVYWHAPAGNLRDALNPGLMDGRFPGSHSLTFSALADRLEALLVDAPVVERVS